MSESLEMPVKKTERDLPAPDTFSGKILIGPLNFEPFDPNRKVEKITEKAYNKLPTTEKLVFQKPAGDCPENMVQYTEFYYNRYCAFIHKKFNQHLCTRCWFLFRHCMCGSVAKIDKSVTVGHSIHIVFKVNELGSSSNSGKLLLGIDPPDVYSYIAHIPEHMAYLNNILMNNQENSLILYPSSDAVSFREFYSDFRSKNLATPTTLPSSSSMLQPPHFHIVVIESNWSSSRNINLHIPREIRRVVLTNSHRSHFGGARKHVVKDQVCTVGALIHLLREMNDEFSNEPENKNHHNNTETKLDGDGEEIKASLKDDDTVTNNKRSHTSLDTFEEDIKPLSDLLTFMFDNYSEQTGKPRHRD